MSKIVGYTAKNAPKWPFMAIGFLFLAIFIFYLLVISYKENSKPVVLTTSTTVRKLVTTSTTLKLIPSTTIAITAPVAPITIQKVSLLNEKAEIKVREIIFTRSIDQQPFEPIKKIKKEQAGRIYCYTTIDCSPVPQKISHVWLGPSGTQVADIPLYIHSQPGYTYSYVTLSDSPAGKWEVQVKDSAGNVLGKSDFVISE